MHILNLIRKFFLILNVTYLKKLVIDFDNEIMVARLKLTDKILILWEV